MAWDVYLACHLVRDGGIASDESYPKNTYIPRIPFRYMHTKPMIGDFVEQYTYIASRGVFVCIRMIQHAKGDMFLV